MSKPPLTFAWLRQINSLRSKTVYHPCIEWTVERWAIAMGGEAGEVLNAVKKWFRVEDGINGPDDPQTKEEAIDDILEEIADTVLYADLLAEKLGMTLEEAIVKKFNRVSKEKGCDFFL